VLALTDELGDVTDTYEYNEYGALIASTGTSHNPYRFTGQQFDSDSGLYYLRDRYYDPATGRFISIDPINNILEKYIYAKDNPATFIDPQGYLAQVIVEIIVVAGVVVVVFKFCKDTFGKPCKLIVMSLPDGTTSDISIVSVMRQRKICTFLCKNGMIITWTVPVAAICPPSIDYGPSISI
jgi:RHS repeat-associated protein